MHRHRYQFGILRSLPKRDVARYDPSTGLLDLSCRFHEITRPNLSGTFDHGDGCPTVCAVLRRNHQLCGRNHGHRPRRTWSHRHGHQWRGPHPDYPPTSSVNRLVVAASKDENQEAELKKLMKMLKCVCWPFLDGSTRFKSRSADPSHHTPIAPLPFIVRASSFRFTPNLSLVLANASFTNSLLPITSDVREIA